MTYNVFGGTLNLAQLQLPRYIVHAGLFLTELFKKIKCLHFVGTRCMLRFVRHCCRKEYHTRLASLYTAI